MKEIVDYREPTEKALKELTEQVNKNFDEARKSGKTFITVSELLKGTVLERPDIYTNNQEVMQGIHISQQKEGAKRWVWTVSMSSR